MLESNGAVIEVIHNNDSSVQAGSYLGRNSSSHRYRKAVLPRGFCARYGILE